MIPGQGQAFTGPAWHVDLSTPPVEVAQQKEGGMGSQDCECSRFVNESRVLSAGAAAAQEEPRRELLQMSEAQLEDLARVCNRYPDIQLSYQLEGGNSVPAGEQVTLTAQMEREIEGDLRPVDAPRCAAVSPWRVPACQCASTPDSSAMACRSALHQGRLASAPACSACQPCAARCSRSRPRLQGRMAGRRG